MYAPNEIIIDPGHGWSDPCGSYDSGHMLGRMDEVSLIDGYVGDLCDVLLVHSIPFTVLPTRLRPGLTPAERADRTLSRVLHLSCHIGQAKQVAKNGGHVYVKTNRHADLAICQIIADTIHKWGATTCKNYAGVRIIETKAENLPDYSETDHVLGIQIEPFCLNAIDAVVYACRLRQLGSAIAESLISYLCSANPGLRKTKTMVWENMPGGATF